MSEGVLKKRRNPPTYHLPVTPLARRRRKWVSRDISFYQQIEQVGEGTYGYAYSFSVLHFISVCLMQKGGTQWPLECF